MTDVLANKVWEGEYLPFGEEYTARGAIENNRQFIGKEKDTETGLDFFGARYMDVGVGRFLAPDPIRIVDAATGQVNSIILGDPQRLNVYGYGLNNPYRYVDQDGLSADDDLDQDGKPDIGPEVDPDGDGHPGFNPIIGGVAENTVIFPPPVLRFASKGGVNKNSLNYVGETHVYRIKGAEGTYKIGDSAQGTRVRDDASIRAE